jgi:hypothetical protein
MDFVQWGGTRIQILLYAFWSYYGIIEQFYMYEYKRTKPPSSTCGKFKRREKQTKKS